MKPTFPADLSTLSIEELQALIDASVAWSQANATGSDLAGMTEVLAGCTAVKAELAGRTPAEPTPTVAELAAQITAVTPAPVAAEVAAVTEPPVAELPTPSAGGFSLADLTAAVTAGVSTAVAALVPAPATLEVIEASAGDIALPDLSRIQGGLRVVPNLLPEAIRPEYTITASADIPGHALGQPLSSLMDLGQALESKRGQIGHVPEDSAMEKVTVAKVWANFPPERVLHEQQSVNNYNKIEAVNSFSAITAAGGRCVPAMPYYGLMVDAGAERPLLNGLMTFVLERMAITVLAPPTIDDVAPVARVVTDGATNTNTTVTSATAAFLSSRDRGATISGTGIPAGAYIVSVESAISVTISAAATATATGLTLTITRRGPISSITQAQDLAGLDATTTSAAFVAAAKYAYHVTCPSATTYELEAIAWFLEFGNWTGKAFPESIPANVKLVLSEYARVCESKLLTKMKAASTTVAESGKVGTLRAYIAMIAKYAAYLRNRHRLPDSVTLRLIHPRWAIAAFQADVVMGSGYELEFLTQSRQVVASALAELNVVASDYIDGAPADSQLFAPGPGNVQGGKLAASGTLTFPTTMASFLFPEGSFLAGVSPSIDFGIWRDSFLNEANNYRMGFEGWETIVPLGYEMIQLTTTSSINGTFAGPAYGSTGLTVALPTTF